VPSHLTNKGFSSLSNNHGGLSHFRHKKPVQSLPTLQNFVASKSPKQQQQDSAADVKKATSLTAQGPARIALVDPNTDHHRHNSSSEDEEEWYDDDDDDDSSEEENDDDLRENEDEDESSSETSFIKPAAKGSRHKTSESAIKQNKQGRDKAQPVVIGR